MAKKSSKKEIVKKIALFGGQLLRNVASNMSYSQGGGSLQFWDNGMPPWEMSQPKPKRKQGHLHHPLHHRHQGADPNQRQRRAHREMMS